MIGAVGNYSGPAGSSHVGMARALQAWAQWTNDRGGLCGRRVQILTTDDHSDPAQFRSALQEMVERRHVVAFSNHDTLTGDAGISYLERVGVPGVGGSCSVSAEYDSPIFFLPCPRPDVLFFGMARNAALFGPSSKRFGLLTCREVAVCGATPRRVLLEEHGARDAGVQVVYEGQASIAQPDYTSECIGARSNHADTLAVILDLASVQRVGQACARQGFYPTYSLVTSIAATTKDLPGFRDLFVALPTFSFAGDATPAQREFHDVMGHYLGSAPGGQETVGWTSAKLLQLAITTAATHRHEITPATVVEALHTLRSETLGGLSVPVSFPAGKPGTYPYCWFTVRATGGQWSAANGGKPLCRS